ncbi:MAG: hypothetical protein AAF617_17065, partial [Bacteroidota bacterium]
MEVCLRLVSISIYSCNFIKKELFKKIKAYHTTIINKGVEHVSSEFDKRALKLLNLISLFGGLVILPVVIVRKLMEADYIPIFIILLAEVILFTIIYLNGIGKNQVSCLLFLFVMTTFAYPAVFLDK